MKSFIVIFALVAASFAQAPSPPTSLSVVADGQTTCDVTQVACVSQVNGVPVCPYGRVGYYPKQGQQYTIWTYPKNDPSGNPINFLKCVYTLPPDAPWFDPNFLTGVWF